MRVLVTGGAGFVGSHLVRHLLAAGEEVTVLDALTYAGGRDNLDDVAGAVRFVEGDVCDRDAVAGVMAGQEAVVHLAAETHVDRSLLAPDAFVRTNCTGTNVVCDEARRAGVGSVLHVSTDEVYGPVPTGAATEEAPLAPSSPYSASKAGADLIALAHHRSHGLPVVVTRGANQYGPRQFPEKLVPHFVTTLLEGGRAPLYGDGEQVRDWLHVEDACAALALVLRRGVVGEVYNVGASAERTNREVAEAIVGLLGVGPDRIEPVVDRDGHDRRYALDSTKVTALGWAPQRSFDEGLAETVAWYVEHPDWWRPRRPRVRNR